MNVDYSYVQKTIDFIVKERLRAISDQILEDTFQAVYKIKHTIPSKMLV
jgi:hypothetical protein